MQTIVRRDTRYHLAIEKAFEVIDHPTNKQLLQHLRKEFPGLSATTVHRITARMVIQGKIGIAPNDKHGSTRFDRNINEHDHFGCQSCDRLCDADIRDKVMSVIESDMKECSIPGSVFLTGVCENCA